MLGLICEDYADGRRARQAIPGECLLISLYAPNSVRGHVMDGLLVTPAAAACGGERLLRAIAIAQPATLGRRQE